MEFCTLADFSDGRLHADFFMLREAQHAQERAKKFVAQAAQAPAQVSSPGALRQLLDQVCAWR